MTKDSSRTLLKLAFGVVLIAVLTMWIYHPSTNNQFVFDSTAYLNEHEFWISSLGINHIIWMFLSIEMANWHPLTWISWAIDFQLYGGLIPWGYHFTNNVLHAINSVLVFVSMLVVFALNSPSSKNFPFRTDNSALISALLATLFFSVHPQHVESVAWVAERKDLLCQLFLLLSMLTYVKYVSCHDDTKKRWFNATLCMYLLAVLSKPMSVTFPVVLLLLDVYPLRRTTLIHTVIDSIKQQSLSTLLREKLSFFLLSALLILTTLYAQQVALSNMPFELRLLNAFNSIVLYLDKFVLPLNFTPHYPYFIDVGESISWNAIVPVLSVLALTLASLFAWTRGHHAWLIAWLFYLVTLSPVLGLIQVGHQGAADRYAYLPTLPAYFLLGAGILALLNKKANWRKFIVLLAVLPLLFLLTDKTRRQIQVWESQETLWSHTLEHYPNSHLAHISLGITYLNEHDYQKAAFYFDRAGKLRPHLVEVLAWRGLTYLYLGRYKDAITAHVNLGSRSESVTNLKADQYCIQYNIGWAYAQMDMFEESVDLFNRISPDSGLRPHADVWLSWLDNNNQTSDKSLTAEELPGFCKSLIQIVKNSDG